MALWALSQTPSTQGMPLSSPRHTRERAGAGRAVARALKGSSVSWREGPCCCLAEPSQSSQPQLAVPKQADVLRMRGVTETQGKGLPILRRLQECSVPTPRQRRSPFPSLPCPWLYLESLSGAWESCWVIDREIQ